MRLNNGKETVKFLAIFDHLPGLPRIMRLPWVSYGAKACALSTSIGWTPLRLDNRRSVLTIQPQKCVNVCDSL